MPHAGLTAPDENCRHVPDVCHQCTGYAHCLDRPLSCADETFTFCKDQCLSFAYCLTAPDEACRSVPRDCGRCEGYVHCLEEQSVKMSHVASHMTRHFHAKGTVKFATSPKSLKK